MAALPSRGYRAARGVSVNCEPTLSAIPHILLVDDDRQIRSSLDQFLTASGIRVTQASGGEAMWNTLRIGKYSLIVLDVMMPGEDGLTLCRRLRETGDIPIILLTAISGETDRIIGLEIGADDYICKPFNPRELLARIRAVLRRSHVRSSRRDTSRPTRYDFDGWRLDPIRRVLCDSNGAIVDLTAGEFELLLVFVEHAQHLLSRDQLLDLTRGRASPAFDRSIDVQVSRLRRKIETDPQQPALIKTVRSGGYVFAAKVALNVAEPTA